MGMQAWAHVAQGCRCGEAEGNRCEHGTAQGAEENG